MNIANTTEALNYQQMLISEGLKYNGGMCNPSRRKRTTMFDGGEIKRHRARVAMRKKYEEKRRREEIIENIRIAREKQQK
jgi:hypothetical protein